jgi:hypothetical protein
MYVSQQYKERFVAFLWQQWLSERTTVFGYSYIAYLVLFVVDERYVDRNSFS